MPFLDPSFHLANIYPEIYLSKCYQIESPFSKLIFEDNPKSCNIYIYFFFFNLENFLRA